MSFVTTSAAQSSSQTPSSVNGNGYRKSWTIRVGVLVVVIVMWAVSFNASVGERSEGGRVFAEGAVC